MSSANSAQYELVTDINMSAENKAMFGEMIFIVAWDSLLRIGDVD